MSDLFPSLIPEFAAVGQALWRALRCCGRGIKKSTRIVVLYILPPLIVLHIAATLITGRLVGAELARLAAAGHPLTLAEIAPPVPPPGENAADVYQQAFDALRLSEEESEEIFPSDARELPEVTAIAREIVATNEHYFDLLDRASRMPKCVFPVDWEAGANASFPYFTKMRDAARMLAVRATVLNADGRSDEALADCLTIFRLSEQAKTDPIIIAQLVAFGIQFIAVPVAEETICSSALSAWASRGAFEQLTDSAERPSFDRVMQCELAFGLWAFDYVRRGPTGDVADLVSQSYPAGSLLRSVRWCRVAVVLYRTAGRPLLNLDELAYLRAWQDYFAAFEVPWPESGERVRAIEAAVNALPAWRTMVTRFAFPVFARVVWTREVRTAGVRAAQVAVAVAGYRAERSSLPTSLAELEAEGWDLPTDPFGGGPFHYRREGDGFVVWSIGPDMEDDNAARDFEDWQRVPPDERAEYDYDVIFRCSS